jgi:protein SCO1/2
LRRGRSSSKKPDRAPRTWIVALLAACAFAVPLVAGAKTARIHGVILEVTPANGEAIVRHDPFDGMPSMAMPFRILPRARAAELLPGNVIDATADTSTDPWTLRDITISQTQAVSAPAGSRVVPLHVGDTVPDSPPFVDQTGRPFRFSQLRGQDAVLAFIYTRCQDPQMCPLISSHFNVLQREIGTRNVHLVEVTLDPSYDRPPVLARYARMFGADPRRWTLAVGDAQPTLDFAARFGIAVFPDPVAGIIHSENTVEIGPDGIIRKMIPDAAWQPDEILADIDASRAANADPLARVELALTHAGVGEVAVVLLLLAAGVYLGLRLGRRVFAKRAPRGASERS